MARTFVTFPIDVTPSGNITLGQLVMPANQQGVLRAIDINPQGSTAASAPLLLELCTQDGAGTSSDAAADLSKNNPAGAETIQTGARKTFTAEPATSTHKHYIALHQQATMRWIPPNDKGEILMLKAERWAIRKLAGDNVALKLDLHFEE